jgi:hypothetical protein
MRSPVALFASALLAGSITIAHAQKTNAARSFNKAIYGDDSHGRTYSYRVIQTPRV